MNMKVKMILPSLTEAGSPFWRPIKYSLFPPLGLATLAGYLDADDEVEIVDQHVENLNLEDSPDLVIIQVYITNAYRAYRIADSYRQAGSYVVLGGLHVTALPDEAAPHADSIFLGPGEDTFPEFLRDLRNGKPGRIYRSTQRSLLNTPPVRHDLIKRHLYLVPNSIVVSRGCPHHCDFCYKDSFFSGGKTFYTKLIDDALLEIEKLPGRHLYFLDDHLFANPVFASALFDGMSGMNRVFQAAGTVRSVLSGNLMEKAAKAGLRSLFVGFETMSPDNLLMSNKSQNLNYSYDRAIRKLHELGIMINASFIFGMDSDDRDVFSSTVDWAVKQAVTTATFHVLTPYPDTPLFRRLQEQKRITSFNWDEYDTRHAVFTPARMTGQELEEGYNKTYRDFYSMNNILASGLNHEKLKHILKHLAYTFGWKKMEPLWGLIIQAGQLTRMRPILESILSKVEYARDISIKQNGDRSQTQKLIRA
jgi:radical SAM superfamily enzyme YgiQ (UPF0313 family)